MIPDTLTHQCQPHVNACGHACVAMLADVPVADVLGPTGHRVAMNDRDVAVALARYGIASAINVAWSPVMILVVPAFQRPGWMHYVVADYRDVAEPVLLDPANDPDNRWTLDIVMARGFSYYIACFDAGVGLT